MTTIKTGVIGYGFSATTFHIPFVKTLPQFELSAISTSKVDTARADYPEAQVYVSADELISDPTLNLVIITAPNDVHFSLAKAALEAGKHVILEKPFVTNVQDGETLIALAHAKGLNLSVYQNRRWDGDFLTVKQLINDGTIGDIKWFESHMDRFRPDVRDRWREKATVDGSGILFDLGAHLIDQALQLFGIPTTITAQCRSLRQKGGANDFFNIMLDYGDKLVQLHANPFSPEPNLRFKLLGSKGKYCKYGFDPQEARLKDGLAPDSATWSQETKEQFGQLHFESHSEVMPTVVGGYEHFFNGVADAINGVGPNPVPASDALITMKLMDLAVKSSELKQTIEVKL